MSDITRRFVLGGLGVLCVPISAVARWKPEYADIPKATRDWYESREMNLSVQKRHGFSTRSCCSHSDVVDVKFRVDKDTKGDVWSYQLPDGSWKAIPEDVVIWNDHAPGGKATLFKYQGHEVCFFPPQGGN